MNDPTETPKRDHISHRSVNASPQPNRMIRLFQNKGDAAFAKYLAARARGIANHQIGSTGWEAAVLEAAKLEVESTIWFRAADLLRKEELQK